MTNINRHNYEEFFLLYADNELSVAERMAVEQFVEENPDLAVELDLLLQTTLSPTNDLFELPNKEQLYRSSENEEEIGIHNYEEKFLLYIDQELKGNDKGALETYVLQHPELQEEFMLLKQTVLPVETLVFPYKESLYRKEEKAPRTIPLWLNWQRFAAAAVFGGMCFLAWQLLDNKAIQWGNPLQEQFAAQPASKNSVNQPAANNRILTEEAPALLASVSKKEVPTHHNHSIATAENETEVELNDTQFTNVAENTVNELMQLTAKNISETRQPIISTLGNAANNDVADKIATDLMASNALRKENSSTVILKQLDTEIELEPYDESYLTQQVVYHELDAEEDSNNKSLLLGSLDLNKDKLRGFFRKAASIFRAKPKQEAEKDKTTETTSISRSLK